MFLVAAIALGFLGSFHCVGMCGPIALNVPVKSQSHWGVFFAGLLYNMGRVLTYSIIGLLFGVIGQGLFLAGFQNALSIALGTSILAILLFPKLPKLSSFLLRSSLWKKITHKISKLIGQHTWFSLFSLGIFNGLLPCGLVYLGVSGAMAQGSAWKGSLFMAFFGIGTLPAMLTITLIKDQISLVFRSKIRSLSPLFIGITAMLLVLRGLNLGIPYISPLIEKTSGLRHHQCCHK